MMKKKKTKKKNKIKKHFTLNDKHILYILYNLLEIFFVYPDEKLFNDIRIMTALRASMKPLDIEKAII